MFFNNKNKNINKQELRIEVREDEKYNPLNQIFETLKEIKEDRLRSDAKFEKMFDEFERKYDKLETKINKNTLDIAIIKEKIEKETT